MNKQELIEHISNTLDEYLKNTTFVKPVLSITKIAKSNKVSLEFEINKDCILLDDVSYQFGYEQGKLDGEWVGQQLKDADKIRQELNKPTMPQFVADWIEEGRKHCKDVSDLFGFDFTNEEVGKWFLQEKPFDLVARAWLDGYTVEKEKRYLVRIKRIMNGDDYLNFDFFKKEWYLADKVNHEAVTTHHTYEELEQAGFGWVFDCPGVEIEEVQDDTKV